ncbi:MAG: response regulator [Myxococcales bacterium]|nr:response regulator [Myxococcales bacterium]
MIRPNDILNGKILIVDDEEANVALLEQLLKGAGYVDVSSTTDSGKVCELHLVNAFDLILLDLHMPGMDGFQVMENLEQIERDSYIPVLVLTAHPDHKVRALNAGARDFISKPFDLAEVLARVHNMLEVRLLHRKTKELYSQVLAEQMASERLVKDVPNSIAVHFDTPAEALTAPGMVVESYAEVMVLFADLMKFTRFAEGTSARVLTGVLDAISKRFEDAGDAGAFVRTGAVGEAYLAAIGLPDAVADRSITAAKLALDVTEAMDRFNSHARCRLKVRIGFDSLPVGEPEARSAHSFEL